MTEKQLRESIDDMLLDIEFEYKGVSGAICPFSRDNIAVKYGDSEHIFESVDALFNEPFFDGKPLKAVCHKFII